MTDKLRQAAEMALDALQNHSGNYKLSKAECVQHNDVADALRQALAEPPKRDWVELTSQELTDIVDFYIDIYGHMDIPHTFARAIEAKLKEINA